MASNRRPETHRPLVNAILDSEHATTQLANLAADNARASVKQAVAALGKIAARIDAGKISLADGKRLWADAFKQVVLMNYVQVAGPLQKELDTVMDVAVSEGRKLGSSIKEIQAIRGVDRREREAERAAAAAQVPQEG